MKQTAIWSGTGCSTDKFCVYCHDLALRLFYNQFSITIGVRYMRHSSAYNFRSCTGLPNLTAKEKVKEKTREELKIGRVGAEQ